MGVVLKWRTPDLTEATYDQVLIYRSTSQGGTYVQISTQAATDNTYFDYEGTSSNWYKIRFYQTSTAAYSTFSAPIQGGTFIGLCTPDDVRKIADISTSELTDSQLWDIIQFAQAMFNKETSSKIVEEPVLPVGGDERQNKIDGINKDFYVRKSYEWYIGDLDGDGEVTVDDVIVWEYDSENDTKTKRVVTAVDSELGKITLESPPPSGHELTITYVYTPVNVSTPEPMVNLAVAYLAAAFAYTKADARCFDRMSLGRLNLARTQKSFVIYYDQYRQMLSLIKIKLAKKTDNYFTPTTEKTLRL